VPPCPDDTEAFFRRYTQVGFNRKFMADDPRTNPFLKERVQEADLLCGRIPPSIFVRHYFSPAIRELRDRTLRALSEMAE
jgi:hypothetical protein